MLRWVFKSPSHLDVNILLLASVPVQSSCPFVSRCLRAGTAPPSSSLGPPAMALALTSGPPAASLQVRAAGCMGGRRLHGGPPAASLQVRAPGVAPLFHTCKKKHEAQWIGRIVRPFGLPSCSFDT